jgi:tRNA-2-methylthio-N6-dimethylallyladenosine synthase
MITIVLRLLFLPCVFFQGYAWSSPLYSTTRDTSTWFPRRIQETIGENYRQVVPSVYVRQIVVETKDVARMAVDLYLQCREEDPFGSIASNISVVDEDMGRGWIEVSQLNNSVLPPEVQQALFDLSPKLGDVHILPSNIGQYHVIKVEELAVFYRTTVEADPSFMLGGHSGQNALVARSKFKGQGVTPELPQHPKTYLIHTAGCQMNVADTERLAGVLENALQLTPVSSSQTEADVVIFNTCTIRDHAEQKVYDALGPYAQQKRKGRQFALIVTGCVAQQQGEQLLRRVPEVDVVMGPQYVPHLKNVLESVEWGQQVVATSPIIHQEDWNKPIRGHDLKAWVNVIYGCNEHCECVSRHKCYRIVLTASASNISFSHSLLSTGTYCVVPAVRGMEQSRPMENILKECLDLTKNGYKEITLLGQNIDAYGRDMVPRRTFADLLDYLNVNLSDTKVRIRYVTSHPRYFSDRVIDAVASLDKVCECFHMPFQAGDNEVLKRMRRGYTYDSYMRIIDKIRRTAPDASICADVIVGFPGETDEAFQRTLDLMRDVKFDNLNSFCYSPRPNTEAALWEDQVPEEIKSERLQIVQTLAAQHGLERSMRYVGRTVEVLVEDGNPRNPSQVMGRTRQGRQVFFDGDLEQLRGEFVDVYITEARTWSLMGELA